MNIYLLPGLGTDDRLFKYLDLKGFNASVLNWITPLKNEPIDEYAKRLAPKITGEDPVLIGMSFGGMMAIEIAKITTIQKVILISSAVNYQELPWVYRVAGRVKLHRIVTGRFLKRSHQVMNWLMSAIQPIRKQLLADILRDTDERFLHWAVEKIVTWRNTTELNNISRIHGDNDRVLPFRRADYRIKGGTHLMVANRAPEVTAAIKDILVANNH